METRRNKLREEYRKHLVQCEMELLIDPHGVCVASDSELKSKLRAEYHNHLTQREYFANLQLFLSSLDC